MPAGCRTPAQPALPPPSLCSYALDVNINSLDVLNHKRLLDSARSDPSAVSFQLRPVDVVSGSDLAKRPSFGSLDTLQLNAEVRLRLRRRSGGLQLRWAGRGRTLGAHCTRSPACQGLPHRPCRNSTEGWPPLLPAGFCKQLLAAQAGRRQAAPAPRLWVIAQFAGAVAGLGCGAGALPLTGQGLCVRSQLPKRK